MREREITHLRDALGITALEERVAKLEPISEPVQTKLEFPIGSNKSAGKKEGDK